LSTFIETKQPHSAQQKRAICLVLSLLLCALPSLYSQDAVTIPKGADIMVDGVFSEGEWSDAHTVTIAEGTRLHFKQSGKYIYIGVQFSSANNVGGWIDIYLQGNPGEIVNLHSSRKLGERKLAGDQWPEFDQWWTTRGDWTANYGKPDDIQVNGKRKEIWTPVEGWEFQIKRGRFKSNQWQVLFEPSCMFPKGSAKRRLQQVFPTNGVKTKPDGWMTLKI